MSVLFSGQLRPIPLTSLESTLDLRRQAEGDSISSYLRLGFYVPLSYLSDTASVTCYVSHVHLCSSLLPMVSQEPASDILHVLNECLFLYPFWIHNYISYCKPTKV